MVSVKKTPRPGLYANIHAKQDRIAHGSGERMRKPGSAGSPSEAAFAAAAGEKSDKRGAKAARAKSATKAPAKKAAGRG